MIIKIATEFTNGQIVYQKVDPDQRELVVTGILVQENNALRYQCADAEESFYFFGFELRDTPDEEKKLKQL